LFFFKIKRNILFDRFILSTYLKHFTLKHFFFSICVLGCCLLFATPVLGQSRLADSLERLLLTAPPDTHRVSMLYDLAWEILDNETDKAEQKLWEAVALAQKTGFKAGEANAWNGLGNVEEIRGNAPKAITYYEQTLQLRTALGDEAGVARVNSNIGKAYAGIGDLNNALLYQRQNLFICEKLKDANGIARAHLALGNLMQDMGFYPEAYEQVNQYRQYVEDTEDLEGKARAYTLLGHIRFELEMLGEARNYYEKALQLWESLNDKVYLADALSDLANVLDELDTTKTGMAIPYYMKALVIRTELDDQLGIANIYNNLGDAYKHLKKYELGLYYLNKAFKLQTELDDQPGLMETYNTFGDVLYGMGDIQQALGYVKKYFEIAQAIHDDKFVQRGYKDFAKIYAAMGDYKKAFEYRVLYDDLRYKRLDETRATDFERKDVVFSEGRKQRELEQNQHQLELQNAKIARANIIGIALIGGALALAILVALLFNRSRIRAKANRELAAKNITIEKERARADNLLKNILPEKTAEELKLHNTVQPVRYESVSVLFSDFKGFTTIAELVTPEDLIRELDECFKMFDEIAAAYRIEKIKTIGDSYMCAAGLPEVNETHAVDMVRAAIEMQRRLHQLMRQKQAEGKPAFEMRIGINSGPVVAGIVGSHKFAYDIWGDTVNTAARLEQGGVVNKINISEATYQLVKHRFECTYRGKMAAKNKGDIDMYFVEYDLTTDTSG
jgi:class 3 adenylate cyclase